MQVLRLTMVVALLLASLTPAGVLAEELAGYFVEPQTLDPEGFRDVFSKVAPHVYMAGQPSERALERVKALGVTKVINLRTDMEMDNRDIVPFDEAAVIAGLEMDYVRIPSGGPNTPYRSESVDQFAAAIADVEGDVLLHCTVAWRATHLWTAYLIKHQNVPFAEAVAIARQLNLGTLPLEGFLGQPLTVGPLDE